MRIFFAIRLDLQTNAYKLQPKGWAISLNSRHFPTKDKYLLTPLSNAHKMETASSAKSSLLSQH